MWLVHSQIYYVHTLTVILFFLDLRSSQPNIIEFVEINLIENRTRQSHSPVVSSFPSLPVTIYIQSKVSKSIGMLNCACRNLSQNTLRKLYFAFVYLYFNYCIDVWGCCSRQQFQSLFILQKVQKRAICIISGVSRDI